MDKTIFYTILDIDNPAEFQFYENMAALLEEDEYIETNLIKDLFKDVDKNNLAELTDGYFEELLKMIPDEETDLYITVESIKRALTGMITEDMEADEIALLADEFQKARKWYVHDLLAFDMINGTECSVRDAVTELAAARLIGGNARYDFRLASDIDIDGYDMRITDSMEDTYEDDLNC